ncbi:four-carbon acid sugar kinase family protein [Klebsiella aerogenes]|uniref:four-carbon acid sugar kinase family protein n=1 Tax=Klebsiella aerogenes TaxID=548 RepID=UPI00388ED0C4
MPTVPEWRADRDIPLTSGRVISLKTRSCPAEMAVSQSLAALRWLQAGLSAVYFKYCSTFDAPRRATLARCWMPCWPSWVRRGR